MSKLQPVRGTHDLLPSESRKWMQLVDIARETAARYGHKEISVPVFEFTEVFARTLGDATDIVTKEMYTFTDRGGENITLRPEFTAGICRAFISGGLAQQVPLKLFAYGPVFRYERPQKGRMRQFHQIDIETIGAGDPYSDIEMIAVGNAILQNLGLKGKVKLEINSLGDAESRAKYRAALVAYYQKRTSELSEESKKRLEVNPLRILDSKDEGDRKVNVDAPKVDEHYTDASRKYFDDVLGGLADIGIAYEVSKKLVRGLDYYNDTVFEFTTELLGSQNAVLAGGRYNGLIKQMGGQETPAVGFAAGVERLFELAEIAENEPRPVFVMPVGEGEIQASLKLVESLRKQGFNIEATYSGKMDKKFKRADKVCAKFAVVIGSEELAAGQANVKDMDSGNQEKVALSNLPQYLSSKL